MNNNLILLFLLSIMNVHGQDFYSVISENGLIIRDNPNLNSKQIGKFSCGEDLKLIENTGISLEINNKDHLTNGHWYLVSSHSGKTGYVFSGYLTKKFDDWRIGATCENDSVVCSIKSSSKKYDFEIFNFQIEAKVNKKDTLILYEAVFNEIGDKLLKIKPKKDTKNIAVFYTRLETLNAWGTKKNSRGLVPKWNGNKPFIKLNPINNIFYRIPPTDYDNIREITAKKMKLKRSPNWDQIGEGWWVPRYVYQELIVPYEIKSIIFKIVIINSYNEIETEYIEIVLSYGC